MTIYEYYDMKIGAVQLSLSAEQFHQEYTNIDSIESVVNSLRRNLSLEDDENNEQAEKKGNGKAAKGKVKAFFSNIIKYIRKFFGFLIDKIMLLIRSLTNYGGKLSRYPYPLIYVEPTGNKKVTRYKVERFEDFLKSLDEANRDKFKNYCRGLAEVLMVAGVYRETPSTFDGLLGLAKYGNMVVKRVLDSKYDDNDELKKSLVSVRTIIEHYINPNGENPDEKTDGNVSILDVEGAPSADDIKKFTYAIFENYRPKGVLKDSACVKCYNEYGIKSNKELSSVIKAVGKVVGTKMYKITTATKKELETMNTTALKGLDGDVDNLTIDVLKESVKYENTLTRVYNLLIKGIMAFSLNVKHKINKEPKMSSNVHEDRD